ncbi:branched-chain alpha-keto acid dehydrogenase subunit E2 [Paenibacillus sp. PK3_47]|uniref:suppressor of fused domain protein n=1 Tax=Paenibacillus sp. PK3_47 TaxID=2072642 RepID=UPI00201DCB44|nr:suppressor of fused domain protein [Paenibacillus sp. PK3_47]UQZ33394.1 branched-chain alpha-keto acid dehydrogenase subunit E2 [Paenibacillus sp. PK3_47]
MSEKEVEATGWDAIEEQMIGLYGHQEPRHYAAMLPYMLGGNDPLNGISAYKAEQPYPHWHFVTFGFSELYEKESEDPEYSGYGFELTFRLARTAEEQEPPAWAINLLQNMARYVFSSGNIFASGHHLDANGPICLGADTKLTALAFTDDPELLAMDTPNGRVEFLQMVGITADELEAMMSWNTNAFLCASQDVFPFYITDLSRDSLLGMPVIAEAVRQGIDRDGSKTGILYVDQLDYESGKKRLLSKTPACLTMGARQAGTVAKLLRGRLLKGKELTLTSPELQVVLEPAEENSCEEGAGFVRIGLNEAAVLELESKLVPREGEFKLSMAKELMVRVRKTYIKDQEGNVVDTIG